MSPAAALIIDLVLNLIIAVSSAAVIISYFFSDADVGGEPERKVTLRYFTTDSNILACLAAAVMTVCDAVALASPGAGIPYFARILKYAGTVAVAVTICTVVLFLLPSALAAGGSQTFAFQLKDKSNSAQSQVFRWIATSDSASGIIRVTVNGKTGPTGIVRPGERTRIFLDGSFFRAGANELTVTRVDAGAQPLRFDAAVLGGSWTVGLQDRSFSEFAHEGSPTANYWTLDGNWKSVRRALLGSGSGNTNQVWHFSLPDDLAGRYVGRLTCGVVGNSAADTELSISYDGVEFAYKVKPVTGDEFVRDLDASDLAQGVHRISLVNGKGPSGNYWGPDFVRLDLIAPPNGTMLILR